MDPNNDSNRNSELEKRSFSQLADEIDHVKITIILQKMVE